MLPERYGEVHIAATLTVHGASMLDCMPWAHAVRVPRASHVFYFRNGPVTRRATSPGQRDVLLGPAPFVVRTEFTVRERVTLYSELDDVRRRGWATNTNENVIGICAVGSRLSTPSGRALGAIVLNGPSRFFVNGNEAMRNDLMKSSELLNSTSHAVRAMAHFLGLWATRQKYV